MSASTRAKGKGRDKGKGKATPLPTERDPLLPASSSSRIHLVEDISTRRSSRIRSVLVTVLIAFFSILLSALLFLALLAYSFKPSEKELDVLPKTAFAYAGPDNVQILNVTEDGILVNVTLRCGIDVDMALGVTQLSETQKDKAISEGSRGTGADWWEGLRRWTAHRALDRISAKHIEVDVSKPIHIFPRHSHLPPLLSLVVLETLPIPLVAGATGGESWLQSLSFTALAKPVASTGQMWEFVQQAWIDGEVKVMVGLDKVEARLPEEAWWAKYARAVQEDLTMKLAVPVPALPGLPSPGSPLNLSRLVHLDGYSFSTSEPHALSITAHASLPNPLNNISTTLPFGIPFLISLSDGSEMAQVITSPIDIFPSSYLNLTMSGRITANLSDDEARDNQTHDSSLSRFLQNYLHGIDNPISVRGLSQLPSFADPTTSPPAWLLSSIPSLDLALVFPGPRPPPKIIQSVTIEHMRLAERGGKMRASGTIIAEVELPDAMKTVDVNVVEVLPDVLVYNGEAGDEEADPEDPPPRAFGHILPDEFLDSETELSTDPKHPYRLIVTAPLRDIPLDVLPGRDKVLSDFVGKVVFKGGAEAGVKGTASVRVEIKGVPGRVRLDNLPVKGEFWVGRQRGVV